VRPIRGYSKQTEHLVSEFPITREQMLRIFPLFDVGDGLWMVFCYPVVLGLWPQIDAVVNCGPLDPGQDYMVEGYATEAYGHAIPQCAVWMAIGGGSGRCQQPTPNDGKRGPTISRSQVRSLLASPGMGEREWQPVLNVGKRAGCKAANACRS
jgi:hypothetical protein